LAIIEASIALLQLLFMTKSVALASISKSWKSPLRTTRLDWLESMDLQLWFPIF
jgi:hypothetical protein